MSFNNLKINAGTIAIVFLFASISFLIFPTKTESRTIAEQEISKILQPVVNRLDRIENKIDSLLETGCNTCK